MPVGSFDATMRTEKTKEMKITINWEDDNNASGTRPASVDVNILKKGKIIDTVTLNAQNGWTTDVNLPSGFFTSYTVGEKVVPEGYTAEVSGSRKAGYVINNRRIVEQPIQDMNVRVLVQWEDQENKDALRPSEIYAMIVRDDKQEAQVTIRAAEGWRYQATLPGGHTYTVREDAVPQGYAVTVSGDLQSGFTLINTHTVQHVNPPEPPIPPVNSTKIHIFLAGRNLTLIKEFLWAMYQDMSGALHEFGISYFTRDSIVDIAQRKRKLETFLNVFDTRDWTYPEDDGKGKTYVFTISPSGEQTNMLDFVFHCAGPNIQSDLDPASADAIWLLADGLIYKDENSFDSYTMYLQRIMEGLPKQGEGSSKPVCLIMSQIEGIGHFSNISGQSELQKKVSQQIQETAVKCFGSYAQERIPVAVIPVQVYGGLECVGSDEKGNPILRLCENGYFQAYITENCQTPGFYTVQQICMLWQMDFFVNRLPDADGLMTCIRRHYSRKFGNLRWTPDFLNGDKI